MLPMNVIELAPTECASPVFFTSKKGGTLLSCVGNRKLNTLTVRESYPLPRMDESIDSLEEAQVSLTLEVNSGYWKIEVSKSDKKKAPLISPHKLYQFPRMPFGLKEAVSTFQRAIDLLPSSVK